MPVKDLRSVVPVMDLRARIVWTAMRLRGQGCKSEKSNRKDRKPGDDATVHAGRSFCSYAV